MVLAVILLAGCEQAPTSEIRDNGLGDGTTRPRTPRTSADAGHAPDASMMLPAAPGDVRIAGDAGLADAAVDANPPDAPSTADAAVDGTVSTDVYESVTIAYGIYGQVGVPSGNGIVPEPRRLVEIFDYDHSGGRPATEPFATAVTDDRGFFQVSIDVGYYTICVHGSACAAADLPYYQARCDFTGEWYCAPY